MARWKISHEFRVRLGDKLMELGNIIGGVLIFGQFVSGKELSIPVFIAGIVLMIACYMISFFVSR